MGYTVEILTKTFFIITFTIWPWIIGMAFKVNSSIADVRIRAHIDLKQLREGWTPEASDKW